jgi:hypothetical protein
VLQSHREQFVIEFPNGVIAVGANDPETINAETLSTFTAALLEKRQRKQLVNY